MNSDMEKCSKNSHSSWISRFESSPKKSPTETIQQFIKITINKNIHTVRKNVTNVFAQKEDVPHTVVSLHTYLQISWNTLHC